MSGSLVARSSELAMVVNEINMVEDLGQPIPIELVSRLEELLTGQAEKIDNCAIFISYAKAETDWLDGEVALLQAQKKRILNGVERVKNAAKYVMEKTNSRELIGMRGHKFRLSDSYSVKVIDESRVPSEYLRVIPASTEVNKDEALKALKSGVEIVGLDLQKKTNVIVK